MIKVSSIINESKKEFTRERSSVINDFLNNNDNSVIISLINKERGDSIKFYYIEDGRKVVNDYVIKNAKIIIQALLKNDKKIYLHDKGKIVPYESQF